MKPSRYQRLEFIRLFREKLPQKFLTASDINGKSYRKNMFWVQLKNAEKKCEEYGGVIYGENG